jgi:2-amino-4-hydroxy-6-hydroxymethyldihydropteridine diphosphokinase
MTRYAVALGSNLGERMDHLRRSVDELRELGTVAAISGLYETQPVGGPDQGAYLNAVVLLDTDLAPDELLDSLQEIEARHGRVRTVRWGPRTLDLDIVSVDGPAIDTPDLQVPHPRAADRLFVLAPLCDIWPEAQVTIDLTASEAREMAHGQRVELVAATWADHPGAR